MLFSLSVACLKLLCLLCCLTSFAFAQTDQPVHQRADAAHDQYRETNLTQRRFKHQAIEPLVQRLKDQPGFMIKVLGESVEGRTIYDVSFGTGPTQVLLWSQMHGNEPTATLAGLDLFNLMKDADGPLADVRQTILDSLTVHFIPMLNPDGAEVYQRRNALRIDLNRDARRLRSPESRILKNLRDSLKADFGFNLHDQSIYYAAGKTPNPATISFLAPPFNEARDTSAVRNRATQLIVLLNEALQTYIPHQVGRYNDTFEPRAFGDNMQLWGTSTILIESGGYADDPEKQQIRRLNFMLLVTGLHAIATRSYAKKSLADYDRIPTNVRHLYDLLIRNVQYEQNDTLRTVDIGIFRDEVPFDQHRDFFYNSRIGKLGDLSHRYGYEELDASGLTAVPGKTHRRARRLRSLSRLKTERLLRRGYTTVRVKEAQGIDSLRKFTEVDLIPRGKAPFYGILLGNRPNFVLKKNKKVKYAVVNGLLYEL